MRQSLLLTEPLPLSIISAFAEISAYSPERNGAGETQQRTGADPRRRLLRAGCELFPEVDGDGRRRQRERHQRQDEHQAQVGVERGGIGVRDVRGLLTAFVAFVSFVLL